MKKFLLPAGLILNSAVILVNRFVVELPDALSFSCFILAIVLMLIGLVQTRKKP